MARVLIGLLAAVAFSYPVLAQDQLTDAPEGRVCGSDLEQLEEWVHVDQSLTDSAREEALAIVSGHRRADEIPRTAGFVVPSPPGGTLRTLASSATKRGRLRAHCPQSTAGDRIEAFRLAAHE
ncbi:MAG: hypothetical protein ACI8QZ_001690 [Chlamydiales bacterium]|jgi:hypothetical protein